MLILSVISCVVWGSSLSLPELSSDLGFPSDSEMMTMSLLEGFCEDSMDSRFPALSQACRKHSRDCFLLFPLMFTYSSRKEKDADELGKGGRKEKHIYDALVKGQRVWKTDQRNPLCSVPEPSPFVMPLV